MSLNIKPFDMKTIVINKDASGRRWIIKDKELSEKYSQFRIKEPI
jgi:hypothetical protein